MVVSLFIKHVVVVEETELRKSEQKIFPKIKLKTFKNSVFIC